MSMSQSGQPSPYRHPFDKDWIRLSALPQGERPLVERGKGLWVDVIPEGIEPLKASRILLDSPDPPAGPLTTETLYVMQGDYTCLPPQSFWRKGVLCGEAGNRVPPRMHCLWPSERVEQPSIGKLCYEDHGFSIWHMIALEIYDPEDLPAFLKLAQEQPEETVQLDLWEFTTDTPALEPYIQAYLWENEVWSLPWPVLRRLLAYRNPLELCMLVGSPFLDYAMEFFEEAALPGPVRELRESSKWMLSRSRLDEA
jgi:hypothetical protein